MSFKYQSNLVVSVCSAGGKGRLFAPEKCLSICFCHSPLLFFIFSKFNLFFQNVEYFKTYILMCRNHLNLLASFQGMTLPTVCLCVIRSSNKALTRKPCSLSSLFPVENGVGINRPKPTIPRKIFFTMLFSI